MNPSAERNRRVLALFEEACLLPPAERAAFLTERCAGDAACREHVEALLAQDETPGGQIVAEGAGARFLAAQIARDDPTCAPASPPPSRQIPVLAGQYRILRLIGEGGMGSVYEAEQARPRRIVALKSIRPGPAGRKMLKRFEQEMNILGRLHHPGIAQIYEAGASDAAHPEQAFFAMEHVRGRPITDHCAERRLGIQARLALIAKVCDAVHYAHQKGVIHRDLKPANILVTDVGAVSDRESSTARGPSRSETAPTPQPKILDFGVARLTDDDSPGTTMHTLSGQLVGTLPYMSAEQVGPDPDGVDTRADVYALGVIAYELLAGRQPHSLAGLSLVEAVRVIREVEPLPLGSNTPSLRGDLEVIVRKAMEKDRERRYASAAHLGSDIRRYLNGEPIEARRNSALYVLRKAIRRHRGLVGAAAGFVLLLAAFAVVSFIQAERNQWLAHQERGARLEADAARYLAEVETRRADGESVRLRTSLYFANIGFAQAAYSGHDVERMKRILDRCPPDLRGWEWHYLHGLADDSVRVIRTPPPGNARYGFSADLSLVACGSREGLLLLEAETGRQVLTIPCPTMPVGDPNPPYALAFDRRTERLAVGWSSGALDILDLETGRLIPLARQSGGLLSPWEFSPDGAMILCISEPPRQARTISADTGADVRRFPPTDALSVAFSPDGATVAIGSLDGAIRLFSTATAAERSELAGHSAAVRDLAFSLDGSRLASASVDGTVRVWDLTSGRSEVYSPHSNKVWAVAWSPDAHRVASAGTDTVIHITDLATGKIIQSLCGHESTVKSLRFTADGKRLLSASYDATLRWWEGLDQAIHLASPSFSSALLTPDGERVLTGGENGEVSAWNAHDLTQLHSFEGHTREVGHLALSHDATLLVSCGGEGTAIIREAASGRVIHTLVHPDLPEGKHNRVLRAEFDPHGRWLITHADDGKARIWDLVVGRELRLFTVGERSATALAIAPQAPLIASGSLEGPIKLWNPETLALVRTLEGHDQFTLALCFSADGSRLVSAGEDGRILAWDMNSDQPPREFRVPKNPIYTVRFSPDGTRLVSGGWDNMVRLWDADSGEELLTLRGHTGAVVFAEFTPDGKRIISGCNAGFLNVWDAFPRTAYPQVDPTKP